MTQPQVLLLTQDGQLGAVPTSAGLPMAVLGPATAGPIDTPTVVTRDATLASTFGAGAAVDIARHHINRGGAVIFVRTGDTTLGAAGTLDDSGVAGTSAVTVDSGTEPDNEYEIVTAIVTGGTVGTAGITYKTSRDGGRNYSAVTALGTANTIVVPNTGGFGFDLAAGTLVAGDTWNVTTTSPAPDAGELSSALLALKNSSYQFDEGCLATPVGSTEAGALETAAIGMHAVGKDVMFRCRFRLKDAAETEAAYKTAFDAAFSASALTHVVVHAGDEELLVSGGAFKRSCMIELASRSAKLPPSEHIAAPLHGGLTGRITDADGNPKHHNETLDPGLGDSRASCLRTIPGLSGLYPNEDLLMAAEGSDFRIAPHRKVFNKAMRALRSYFAIRLNSSVRVDALTGFIKEEDALEIENGAKNALRIALLATPDASAIGFRLDRDNNLLSGAALTGDATVTPKAYLRDITVGVAFFNPALIQAVS